MNAPKPDPRADADTALCLSLRQPYIEWVLDLTKTLEIRSWTTSHRGRLILHASNRLEKDALPILEEGEVLPDYPRGLILGECRLVDIRTMTQADEAKARVKWRPDAHAWVLKDVVRYGHGIAYKGALSLFPVPTKILPPAPVYAEVAR